MTLPTPKNRVGQATATTGTGTITLGAAESGYAALVAGDDAKYFDYVIVDGTAWEVVREGLYTHTGTTLTRGTLEASSTGNAISLSGSAKVYVTQTAKRITDAVNLAGAFGMAEISVTGATTATIGHMHLCSGTTADYTVTLPAASGNAGKLLGFRMAAGLTKLVTLDGNASETIDGELTRVMWAEESATLLCDGSNWFKVAGKSRPMICQMAPSTTASISNETDTKLQCNTAIIDNTGLMASTGNYRIYARRKAKYMVTTVVRANNIATTAVSRWTGWAWKNETTTPYYAQSEAHAAVGSYVFTWMASPVDANKDDYFYLYSYHAGSGVSQTMHADGTQQGSNISLVELPQW